MSDHRSYKIFPRLHQEGMEALGGRPKKVQVYFQLFSIGKSEKGQENCDKLAWFNTVPPECLAWRIPHAAAATGISDEVTAVRYASTNEGVAPWASRMCSPWIITAPSNVWAFQGPISATTSSLLCERCPGASKCIARQKQGPPSSSHLWHGIDLLYSFLTLGINCLWHKILKQMYLWHENKDPLEPTCISLCDSWTQPLPTHTSSSKLWGLNLLWHELKEKLWPERQKPNFQCEEHPKTGDRSCANA